MMGPEPLAITFSLNGRARVIKTAPSTVLADVLREDLGLTGTKVACDQGVCGACTVLIDGRPMASCTEFAFMAEGRSVTTIEGLGPVDALHPIQQAFIEAAAMQCGYCTPGMILLLQSLLRDNPDPDEAVLRQWLSSSVCRCTGYQVIMEAALLAARRGDGKGGIDAKS
jgi:aerobic-type carbon monoxide dehydrogenase small subunit (CoxS/CutS family)